MTGYDALSQYAYEWERHDVDTKESIRGLCAVDENVIWISGSRGLVAKTTNGGDTWEVLYVPGASMLDFRDIHAFNQNKALIMSSGPGFKSKILKTTDGGKQWEEVHSNTHNEGFFNGMDFWNEQSGIMAGDPIDGYLYIAVTNDGGASWSKVENYFIPEIEYQEFGFAASGTHITTFGDSSVWIGTGGKTARIFFSKDMGQHWNAYATPILQGKSSTGIFSVEFKNHLEGLAVGGDYNQVNYGRNNIIATSDRGQTWTLVDSHIGFRSCIQFIDGMYITVGPSGANFTYNNGLSWNPIGGEIGFHTLSAGNSKRAIWAAGSDGKVARLVEISAGVK